MNIVNYHGRRHATFPPDLVRMMLSVSCDDDSLVLDPFGGAGTTAMVALELRHRAITIDINHEYTEEARAPWRHQYRPSGGGRLTRRGADLQCQRAFSGAIRSVRSDAMQGDAALFLRQAVAPAPWD